ncbi:hypothetical protein RRK58_003477 [Vibrio fluvialis]|nr:hypothetical protein [Vibrio fluvialis]ELI5739458.1 hypothetical protein [Vibrio fluvialis]HDM8040768.1 hypothetical protein [Vibrio fluvialis]
MMLQREMIVSDISDSKKGALLYMALFSLSMPITLGFYLHDFVMFLLIFFSLLFVGKVQISKGVTNYCYVFLILVILPNVLSLLFQVYKTKGLEMSNMYLLYNAFLSLIYLFFCNCYLLKHLDKKIYFSTIAIVTPLLLSALILIIPYFKNSILSLYGVVKEHPFRFGGIWGQDVNQLGYYATVVMIWSGFVFSHRKINTLTFAAINVLSISLIALSGMRTGVIVFLSALMLTSIFSKRNRKIFKWYVYLSLFSLALMIATFPIYSPIIDVEPILERFSPSLFYSQLTGSSGDGQLGMMLTKWIDVFLSVDDVDSILFSVYPDWKYPDSLFLYYIANVGFYGFLSITMFVMFCLFLTIRYKLYYSTLVAIFLSVVSIKGNFPVNNFSMLIFTLIVLLESKWIKEIKSDVNQVQMK